MELIVFKLYIFIFIFIIVLSLTLFHSFHFDTYKRDARWLDTPCSPTERSQSSPRFLYTIVPAAFPYIIIIYIPTAPSWEATAGGLSPSRCGGAAVDVVEHSGMVVNACVPSLVCDTFKNDADEIGGCEAAGGGDPV